ncbi:MAG TPA: CoA pyrophosphatase [Gaiellaceae bacterium]
MTQTPAAVLVPVFRDEEGELRIVLVLRGAGGVHGGQVGLPGGKWEPEDESFLATALREADEEIGLERPDVEIVAKLDPIDSRTTGFRVHPFLAVVRPRGEWRLAAGEIEGVVTPLVRALADPAARRREALVGDRLFDCVPLEDGRLLWGLTLRLLTPLLPRLLDGEFGV